VPLVCRPDEPVANSDPPVDLILIVDEVQRLPDPDLRQDPVRLRVDPKELRMLDIRRPQGARSENHPADDSLCGMLATTWRRFDVACPELPSASAAALPATTGHVHVPVSSATSNRFPSVSVR